SPPNGRVRNVERVTPDVSLTSPGNQSSTEGDMPTLSIQASARFGNVAFKANGLPQGLTIDSTSGVIQGTVAAGDASGSPYTVTVMAVDGINVSQSVTFSWTVSPAIVVTKPDPQSNEDGSTIAPLQIQATDARGTITSYTDNGTLPTGLHIDNTGKITGTLST